MAAMPGVCFTYSSVNWKLLAIIVGIRHAFQLGKGLLGQRLHTLVHIRQRGGDLTYRPTTVSVVVHSE